jgi:hypothetical protein
VYILHAHPFLAIVTFYIRLDLVVPRQIDLLDTPITKFLLLITWEDSSPDCFNRRNGWELFENVVILFYIISSVVSYILDWPGLIRWNSGVIIGSPTPRISSKFITVVFLLLAGWNKEIVTRHATLISLFSIQRFHIRFIVTVISFNLFEPIQFKAGIHWCIPIMSSAQLFPVITWV